MLFVYYPRKVTKAVAPALGARATNGNAIRRWRTVDGGSIAREAWIVYETRPG